jgi:quercetin dioxygenase-like cupin family protein
MDYTYIFDLAEHAAELAKEGHPTEHVQGRAIYTDEHVKVLAFPFEAGQSLEEHTAPHPAILHFFEGEAEVTLGGEAMQARARTWIHMAPDLAHSIHARTRTLMLLLILRSVP